MGRTSYPGQLDSDVELPRVDDNITEIGSDAINSLRDAIFSIEEAIGINPQGNLTDFVTRINKVIDHNGVIKSSALSQKGLITLPISNSQIGTNAAIDESKLDLDHATTSLYNSIVSNDVDIEAIRSDFNIFLSRTTSHFLGLGDKHDGYDITLTNPIRNSYELETAVNIINNAFLDHIDSLNSHHASNIEVDNDFNSFSADTVQDALIKLDGFGSERINIHQDLMHSNCVSLNEKGEQGKQGNLKETTAGSTIFQTEISKATNILQVMRPNVARVTSKNIDLGLLSVGESSALRIAAGGIGRSWLDIDLTSIIPTNNIDEVVYTINQTAHNYTNHYPISAYNIGGKLTIAHNIPGAQYTIQILDTIQFSADQALGFSEVTSTVFTWSEEYNAVYAGGSRVSDFKSILKTNYSHTTTPLSLISLELGDLDGYGMIIGNRGRVLLNITNHSLNSDNNGTYYITAFPDNESFIINSDIQLGDFDIEIVSDSVNFLNSANGEIYDIFIEADDEDGYGIVSCDSRVSYGVISGVNIRTVSKDFPTNNVEWQVSTTNGIRILENSLGGIEKQIPTGFIGQMEVFAYDNINSAIFEVSGSPGSAKRTVSCSAFNGGNDKFYVSSVHYSGNYGLYTLKFVTDKRNLGGSAESYSEDKLTKMSLESSLKDLRNNGIIHGFDIISSDENSIKVRGGKALVDGKTIKVETQDVYINEFDAASRLLLLDTGGNFIVKSEFDAGYSFSELTDDDAYGDERGVAIIAAFETDGTQIDGYTSDRRLLVSNIDKRIINIDERLSNKIVQIENIVDGSMWGNTVAYYDQPIGSSIADIQLSTNSGLLYVPSGIGYWDQSSGDATGFIDGEILITNRTFEFTNTSTLATSIFKPIGLTHINVFIEAIYTGVGGGPFGVNGTTYIEIGVAVDVGISDVNVYEEYAIVKTITIGTLPSDEVTERYIVSIPTSQLSLSNNTMFNITPRIRILNSNYIDGDVGDSLPIISFNNIRLVTSSYSIAGFIEEQDGSDVAISTTIGDVL